ncbi:hypothetical protein EMPS_04456 [Entomortierella parvispora]|uniref:Uncharacterized protein n=1 Tax=Entomortierella parvispora TaxID=205924 RepID=A0A9P3LVK9_9FUNG|nr:hypothetical protein EMPS_04456 [Entomortierella parvispora]
MAVIEGPLFRRWPFTVYLTYKQRNNLKVVDESSFSNTQPTNIQNNTAQSTSIQVNPARPSGSRTSSKRSELNHAQSINDEVINAQYASTEVNYAQSTSSDTNSTHPASNEARTSELTNHAPSSGSTSTLVMIESEEEHRMLRKRDMAPYFQRNYVKTETEGVYLKHYYFRIGWFFWFMDKLSFLLGKEFVLCQPRTRTDRALARDIRVDGDRFAKVEVLANKSAIDPPILPTTAIGNDAYKANGSPEDRIRWFISQCRHQKGLCWDDGCMFIDPLTGRIERKTPCACGGRHHRQIQLLLGISMLFPLYMARHMPSDTRSQKYPAPEFSHLVKAVDSIKDNDEDNSELETAIKRIYDDEDKLRVDGNTKKCAMDLSIYTQTLKSIVSESELNDSDFFVARWRLSPDDKTSTHRLINGARKSADRRDKISVIYLLLTYRGLYPADSIALLGRSISNELLDDILEKLDIQTMYFPVDGHEVTTNNLAKDMNPHMKGCGSYDTYFDVTGSRRVLVSLSSTVRRTGEYLDLWQSLSVKGVPYTDRLEGVLITAAILIFNLSPLYWMRHSSSYIDYFLNVADQGSYFIAVTALLAAVATSWRSHGSAYHDMIVGKKHSTKLSHLMRKRSMYDKIPFFFKMVAHYESQGAPFVSRQYSSYMLPDKNGIFELDCVLTIKDLVDAGYKILQTSDRVRSDDTVDRFLWVDFQRSKEARDFELCKEGRRIILEHRDSIDTLKVSTEETALRDHMATAYSDIIVK